MDFTKLLGLKSKIDILQNNHPKFFGFLSAVKNKGIKEGSIFEIKVTTAEGEVLETAIKLSESDIEALRDLLDLGKNMK